jgi:hypothetical protein
MERCEMEAGDAVIDQVGVTPEGNQAFSHGPNAGAVRRRPADPLFKRFAIPKEWRLKDNEGGG